MNRLQLEYTITYNELFKSSRIQKDEEWFYMISEPIMAYARCFEIEKDDANMELNIKIKFFRHSPFTDSDIDYIKFHYNECLESCCHTLSKLYF